MTEADFEASRSHLWHYALKNFVFLPLLPNEDWGQFCVRTTTPEFDNTKWPVLNLQTESAKRVANFWMKGDAKTQPMENAVAQLLKDADQIEFLRRRPYRSPQDDEILAWVKTCTDVFTDGMQPGAEPRSQVFWQSAVKLSTFLLRLENGSKSFWQYFEENT
ncbi:MAG: hypothetical protein L0Z50_42640 [Verrucomicrobiales bacterium]|nr:hypothetical protein [Verrucomicrobiales bacterium]